jgi:hypothetical protein
MQFHCSSSAFSSVPPARHPNATSSRSEPNGGLQRCCDGVETLGEIVQPEKDADYWRRRAEEARSRAETMNVPAAKREMLIIAAAYDRLANHSDRTEGRGSARQNS